MKTTKHHFELFKTEVKKWIKEFGLGRWEINFKWRDSEDGEKESFGGFGSNIDGRTCTFFFCKNWDDRITPLTNESVKQTALHEVLHLLLARFDELAKSRYVGITELNEENEAIVNCLLNFILKRNDQGSK